MGRSITSGALVRPAGRIGEVDVEGPDEDGFTLTVDAIEALPTDPAGVAPGGRVHVVGESPTGIESMLPYALGPSIGEVVRYPGSVVSFWAAVERAQSSPEDSPSEVVVVLDRTGPVGERGAPEWGGGAAAVRVSSGPGAVLLGLGEDEAKHGSGPGTGQVGQARRQGSPVEQPPILPWIRELRAATVEGASGLSVVIPAGTPDERRGVRIHRGSPVLWAERGPRAPLPRTLEELRRRPELAPPTLSEGAYLPRATYLESRPSRWRFVAQTCPSCRTVSFPARGRCRACGRSEGLETVELARSGLPVEATTVVHPGAQPTEFDPMVQELGAYEVVIARAAPTVRVTLQLADGAAGSVRIGDLVDTRLRRLFAMEGEWRYGRKAVRAAVASGRPDDAREPTVPTGPPSPRTGRP